MKVEKHGFVINKKIEIYKSFIDDKKLLNYFKNKIKKDVGANNFVTNVKGQMSLFDSFLKDEKFLDFINKRFLPEMFSANNISHENSSLYEMRIMAAWGNILNKGHYVQEHVHGSAEFSSTLYFSKGEPFRTEAGVFEIEEGLILTFPGYLTHWVNPIKEKERISMVWNWDILSRNFKSSKNI